MSESRSREATLHLQALCDGDRSAVDRLLPHVYAELRELAERAFQGQRGDHTLQPTALVHEAYLRLVRGSNRGWRDRQHFLNVASMAMRQLLANHARNRLAEKRGSGRRRVLLQEVAEEDSGLGVGDLDLVALHEALERLAALNPRQARIVELRFLAGSSVAEIATLLGVTERTVYADWRMARSFLAASMAGELPP